MFRFLPALILLASLRPAFAVTAANLGDEIQNISLDPDECYRIIDLHFNKEDLKVYLGSGYLVFTKPISSTRLGAIFVATADGGDGDILLLPPSRSERSSLATFTNSPIWRNISNRPLSYSLMAPATIFSRNLKTIRPPRKARRWAA